MSLRIGLVVCGMALSGLYFCGSIGAKPTDDEKAQIQALIDKGDFKAAEKLLQTEITDLSAPIASEPAIQLEVLRRTRSDYALTDKDLLAEIQKEIPDATQADIDRWRKAGDFQFRVIDGETRYFRRTAGNLFRVDEEAKKRQKEAKKDAKKDTKKKFNTTAFVEKLVKLSESSESPEVMKRLTPSMCHEPSSCLTALVRPAPTSEPASGSVSTIVAPQPRSAASTAHFFCSSVPRWYTI